jgi:hypothetical protein
MKDYRKDLVVSGTVNATESWQRKLQRLSPNGLYAFGTWRGDFFDKRNPVWRAVGVVKPGKTDEKITVVNTGGARGECGRVLRTLLAMKESPKSLDFLATR